MCNYYRSIEQKGALKMVDLYFLNSPYNIGHINNFTLYYVPKYIYVRAYLSCNITGGTCIIERDGGGSCLMLCAHCHTMTLSLSPSTIGRGTVTT